MGKKEKAVRRLLGYQNPKNEAPLEVGGSATEYLKMLKMPWYFEKAYEKIILAVFFYLGGWKLVNLIKWLL